MNRFDFPRPAPARMPSLRPAADRRRVWVFDLDNTLHDADRHIFPVIDRAMTRYIMQYLGLDETAAHALRERYGRLYGAAIRGLMLHHKVDPQHFLVATHQFSDLAELVVQRKGLHQWLNQLSGRKIVFTNAPRQYASRVLDILGVADAFDTLFSVESSHYQPKPSLRGFNRMLHAVRAEAGDCVMLEDSLPALQTAKRLGMKTVWISRQPRKPGYVDIRVPHVLALTHARL